MSHNSQAYSTDFISHSINSLFMFLKKQYNDINTLHTYSESLSFDRNTLKIQIAALVIYQKRHKHGREKGASGSESFSFQIFSLYFSMVLYRLVLKV